MVTIPLSYMKVKKFRYISSRGHHIIKSNVAMSTAQKTDPETEATVGFLLNIQKHCKLLKFKIMKHEVSLKERT